MIGQTTKTVPDLVGMVKNLLSDTSGNYYEDSAVQDWVHLAINRLARELPADYLPGLQQSGYLTTGTLSNQASLSGLSPAVFRIHRIFLVEPTDAATDAEQRQYDYAVRQTLCLPMTDTDFRNMANGEQLAPSARPPRYYVWKNYVQFFAYGYSSTTIYPETTFSIHYISEPERVDSPVPVSEDAVRALLFDAAKMGFVQASRIDQVQTMENLYQQELQRMAALATMEGRSEQA